MNIEPKYWNDKRQYVRQGHRLATAINDRLQSIKLDADRLVLSGLSADAIRDAISGGSGDVVSYVRSTLGILEQQDKYWEHKKYGVLLRKLIDCFGDALSWNEFDSKALSTFERFLRESRGNGPNTIVNEIRRLHTLTRQASREGLIKANGDPFKDYSPPKRERTQRRKLSLAEVESLESVVLEKGSEEELARDVFLFSFFAGGARFGDICTLKSDDLRDGRLTYRMAKTAMLVDLKLPKKAFAIIAKYDDPNRDLLFPLISSEGAQVKRQIASRLISINAALKSTATKAGISPKGLSSHVARHTYADHARSVSGDIYAVSKTLGHSSLRITESYLKSFDREAVDRLADVLWNRK